MLAHFAWAEDEQNQQNTGTETSDESTASGNALPDRVLPNLFKQREQDLKRYLISVQREDELVNLTSNEETFSGYLLPERTNKPQGGVLILPDNGQHGHWPRVVGPLRDYLPDYGWQTLTISLPDVPQSRLQRSEYLIPTEEKTDQNNEGDNNAEVGDAPETAPADATKANQQSDYYAQQMPKRINAAYQHLNQRGQLNIVIIANGHSATWAANWLASQNIDEENNRGFSLVIIDALDDAYAPVKLTPTLSELDFPVLDIITAANRNNAMTNKKRLGAMKRKKHEKYQQIHINAYDFSRAYSNKINRIVRGWLSKNAAGTEGKVVDSN